MNGDRIMKKNKVIKMTTNQKLQNKINQASKVSPPL